MSDIPTSRVVIFLKQQSACGERWHAFEPLPGERLFDWGAEVSGGLVEVWAIFADPTGNMTRRVTRRHHEWFAVDEISRIRKVDIDVL